jgi:hypothetical protein
VITTICSAIQYRFPEKSGEMSSSSLSSVRVFDRFLAAKPEFSYEAVCTVNLLALRLQWFESTPTQASPSEGPSSFGLFTRWLIGHIFISSAGYGFSNSFRSAVP